VIEQFGTELRWLRKLKRELPLRAAGGIQATPKRARADYYIGSRGTATTELPKAPGLFHRQELCH